MLGGADAAAWLKAGLEGPK
ncbi:hypothetical protein CEXT_588221, partial [Caerostris extrusa]